MGRMDEMDTVCFHSTKTCRMVKRRPRMHWAEKAKVVEWIEWMKWTRFVSIRLWIMSNGQMVTKDGLG